MSMFHDFSTPEYLQALGTAIKYGLGVVLGMLVVGTVLTLAGGGLSAMWWRNAEPDHHH